MSSIYKRKRNGKEDGYVMYSTYAFDPLKNKKRYYNITIGKLGPTLSWDDCKKQKKELVKIGFCVGLGLILGPETNSA